MGASPPAPVCPISPPDPFPFPLAMLALALSPLPPTLAPSLSSPVCILSFTCKLRRGPWRLSAMLPLPRTAWLGCVSLYLRRTALLV
ncbi:hypothetical protein M427DRAFT_381094 [Gonapodya prolifera JEL478]|uniref:Uncharacterized protein n=1 Tax=Gonapodya prolifera (strain JEL478) TaxID=1344416 RepID=A0A139A922_GONPJ|nr:hypothetical protein M427DRAFT_381094 [Gonapodya prolifera JEL478]|eukprot:KXS13237.1 hypothetical protein M427DRAFT_381094 [Gonapodya prolifera JEL478]